MTTTLPLTATLPMPAPRAAGRSEAVADLIRHHVVDLCAGVEGGHLGGSLSSVDILSVLYCDVLRVDPAAPTAPDRDIFLLSKGHAAIALYATLAVRGFFPVAELATFGQRGSRLMGHPNAAVPGVELPTGSLGHGLPLGLGFALAALLRADRRRVFVLVGDGELQEGSNWEAAMAAATAGVPNLVAVVDRNGLQLGDATERTGRLEPLPQRWRDFGWAVREVDGHDHRALREALADDTRADDTRADEATSAPRPRVVIAHTVKGRGVPFAEGVIGAHFTTLTERAARRAHQALGPLR